MRAPFTRPPQRASREQERAHRPPVPPLSPARLRARASSSPPVAPARSAKPGTSERFGAFILHEKLGEGGMAAVYRGERIEPDGSRTPVALKRLHQHLAEDIDFVESFVQEARLASSIKHPNIAEAYELGKLDGTYFIAMELVKGPTLQALMVQSRIAAGAIPLPIIVEILIQLCEALDHAHNLCDDRGRPLGLIHRDVSPANVILSNTGLVKLIDFGVAKAARSRIQTQAGFIKGKLSYVAPEYTHGRLDARADLFAVGVIAHELLTGHRLFDAATDVDVVQMVREHPIQPPSRTDPRITRELDDIVITALQRAPELRWQNAAALRRALEGVAYDLGGRVDRAQMLAWVEWAFTREPWRDSIVARIVDDVARSTPSPRRRRAGSSAGPDELTVPSPRIELTDRREHPTLLERPGRAPLDLMDLAPTVVREDRTDREPSRRAAEDRTDRDPSHLVRDRQRFGEAIARRAGQRTPAWVWLVVLVLAAGAATVLWPEQVVAAARGVLAMF